MHMEPRTLCAVMVSQIDRRTTGNAEKKGIGRYSRFGHTENTVWELDPIWECMKTHAIRTSIRFRNNNYIAIGTRARALVDMCSCTVFGMLRHMS